jgi:hypothetical protein
VKPTDVLAYNHIHTLINHNSITIIITITMSEPPEYPRFATQTPELCQRIATAIAAIPADHWVRLVKNEVFADPQDAYIHIRN